MQKNENRPGTKITTLAEIATFKSGGTPRKTNPEFWGGNKPWISGKDLKRPILTESIDQLSDKGFSSANIAPEDSLLILVRGMTLHKNVPVGLAGRAVAFNQDLKALVPVSDVFPKYLLYYLLAKEPMLLQLVDSAGHGTGRLNTDLLKKFPVLLPPLSEQKAIAEVLSEWDRAIEKTERLIQAKEKRFDWLLSTLICNPDFNRGHVRDFTSEVSARNKGEKIQRVLSVTNHSGFVLPENQFARSVASANLSNYKIVTKGEYAYNPSRINVGSIARLDDWAKGVLSPMYVVFGIDEGKVISDFFLHWLNSHEAKQRIKKSAQGSVRETVSFTDLGSIPFPMPRKTEQAQIAETLNAAQREIDLLKKLADKTKEQKRGLMQKLLTGTWRVSV
jgi:type I restriction enzyme S subunit